MTDRKTQLLEEILTGQKALTETVGTLEQGQKVLQDDVRSLKQGQVDTNKRLSGLEQGQVDTNKRLETVEHGIGALSVAIKTVDTHIRTSQEDTIDALKALLLPPLDSHEERITILEEEVGIKQRKH